MKYILSAFILIFSTSVNAQMTENIVRQFIQNLDAAFASCDPVRLRAHIEKHFTPSYSLTATSPEGETRTVSRAELLQAFTDIPEDFDLSQLTPEDCALKYSVTNIAVNGPNAQFFTLEQEQFEDENGQNRIGSITCKNNATLQNNTVIVTKSNCVAAIQ